jgi:GT2 family glycosyltransferase
MQRSVRVVALISAYNEADIIGDVIEHLFTQGVDVYLIDDGSTDETAAIAESRRGRGVTGVEHRARRADDMFAWQDLLARKEELARQTDADWFIHHDADEFRESPWPGVPLCDAIAAVDRRGYNAIDFDVLNFVPTPASATGTAEAQRLTRYMPAHPADRAQIKCWKNLGRPIDLVSSGGHEAAFEGRRVFPIRFLLRHYPVRGQAHGERKVLRERQPRFLPDERERGWHIQYDHVRPGHDFVQAGADALVYDPIEARIDLALNNRETERLCGELDRALEQARRTSETLQRISTDAESRQQAADRRIVDLEQQLRDLRTAHTEATRELTAARDAWVRSHSACLAADDELTALRRTASWRLVTGFWRLTARLAPGGSIRERGLAKLVGALQNGVDRPQSDNARGTVRPAVLAPLAATPFIPPEPPVRAPLRPHTSSVDIIVCVHDALDDARRCLESIVGHTRAPFGLILIDDGSAEATRAYLERFARDHAATLIRHDTARGYTRAANAGLRRSRAGRVVLLNSDTTVSDEWLDRLTACADADPAVGLVGPLSNAASWQSIPEIESADGADWADNPLPGGMTLPEYAAAVARSSGRLYPQVKFLNGFCLLITRRLIDAIGTFDETAFGGGYGEENDYCLRASAAGFSLAVADDVFVFHAQSRSYGHERRRDLYRVAAAALRDKHGDRAIEQGVEATRRHRILSGVRARSRTLADRVACVADGRQRWAGRRVLFLLPVSDAGGGAKVVLQEARAMRRMGVDARVLNFSRHRPPFERLAADYEVPAIYVETARDVPEAAAAFDAVIATMHTSVEWLERVPAERRAYYVQDFEPWFYREHSEEYQRAVASYGRFPGMRHVTKTEWNRRIVLEQTGHASTVIGPSVDVDGCRPRPRRDGDWPFRPLRIAAMIRPSSPRRQPGLTLEVLAACRRRTQEAIEIVVFGCSTESLRALPPAEDLELRNAGVLNRASDVAALLNEVDIFMDCSAYQAMGLTALEAMASGVAVIVPGTGGALSFARPDENALVAGTSTAAAYIDGLTRLMGDAALRARLAERAIDDAAAFYPERAAHAFLAALFR